MILYLGKFPSEEIAFTTLYEDIERVDREVEIPDDEFADLQDIEERREAWQMRLADLMEKSPRRDKR